MFKLNSIIYSIAIILYLCFININVANSEACEQNEYNAPGTANHPLGDENLNNNILDDPQINESKESKDNFKTFKKCPRDTLVPGRKIFNMTNLRDVKRFEKLVKLYMSNLTHGIADSGHIYAMSSAAGLVSGTAYQKDLLTGLPHIMYMKRLVLTKSYAPMMAELSTIAKALFDKSVMRASLNVTDMRRPHNLRAFETFMDSIPALERSPNASMFTSGDVWVPKDNDVNSHHYVLNVPVHFCSRAVATVPYTHSDHGRLRVLARLITSKYLHPELRERQGAYGGGVRLDRSGVLAFYSYRDPRNLPTLDVFDGTYSWMVRNIEKITPQDLLEAKLGVFQQVDTPVPPSRKGADEFLTGLTADALQRHRAELICVSIDDLREVNEKFLGPKSKSLNGKAILGPKDMKTEQRRKELWTVVDIE